jgi:hypothetical protein
MARKPASQCSGMTVDVHLKWGSVLFAGAEFP